MTVPVILSWSGGKDSSLVLAALRSDPRYDVVALLTSYSIDNGSVSGHGVSLELIEAQARAIGLPLIAAALPSAATNAVYEAAMMGAITHVRATWPTLDRIAFGDLFLEDIRAFREQLAARTALTAMFPLWGRDTRALAREFVDADFRAHLVAVDTTQLGARFVGRAFDHALLNALPQSVDPCGENGEFHTFVHGGPIFQRPIGVACGPSRLEHARFAYCDLHLESTR